MIIEIKHDDKTFVDLKLVQRILEINRGLKKPCNIDKIVYDNGYHDFIQVYCKKNGKANEFDDEFLEFQFQCFEKDDELSKYQIHMFDEVNEEYDIFRVFL